MTSQYTLMTSSSPRMMTSQSPGVNCPVLSVRCFGARWRPSRVTCLLLLVIILIIVPLMLLRGRGQSGGETTNKQTVEPEWSWSTLPQDSPTLVWRINRELEDPATPSGALNLAAPHLTDFSQNGQSCYVAALFSHRSEVGGTFLEAGAYNGEELSNTLFLERELGWRGVLVEPDPWNHYSLRKKNRKALTLHSCLSPTIHATKSIFKQSDTMGRLAVSSEFEGRRGIFTTVVCYPLYSILRAANLTTLDYLALDLEGTDLEVLQTIPWDKVHINVLQIEASHLTGPETGPPPIKHSRKVRGAITDSIKKVATEGAKMMVLPRTHDEIIPYGSGVEPSQGKKSCDFKNERTPQRVHNQHQKKLINFMIDKNYEFVEEIGEDFIFARSDFLQK